MSTPETIGARIAADFRIDFHTMTRGGGWTNAVWLSDDRVIRVSPVQGSERIGREAALAQKLPAQAGYPEVIAYGRIEGHEWSVSKRIQGRTLSDVWPILDWAQKADTLRQIWAIADAVHQTDVGPLRSELPKRTWYSSLEKQESLGLLEALVAKRIFTNDQARAAEPYLNRFYEALPHAEPVLCHGDLTMENMIWHEGRVASLLDFEHAALAPRQLDLNVLLRVCFGPESVSDVAGKDRGEALARFTQEAESLALRQLPDAKSVDLLCGFSILQSLRRVEIWHENADDPSTFARWEPYRSVLAFVEADGGYYGRFVQARG